MTAILEYDECQNFNYLPLHFVQLSNNGINMYVLLFHVLSVFLNIYYVKFCKHVLKLIKRIIKYLF